MPWARRQEARLLPIRSRQSLFQARQEAQRRQVEASVLVALVGRYRREGRGGDPAALVEEPARSAEARVGGTRSKCREETAEGLVVPRRESSRISAHGKVTRGGLPFVLLQK